MKTTLATLLLTLTVVSWGLSYKVGCVYHGVESNQSAEEINRLCTP